MKPAWTGAWANAAARFVVGLALAGLAACRAGHDLDCLKSNGTVLVQRRAIDRQLQAVYVYDNVDVVIVPDTAHYAEVQAGEHVIDELEFTAPPGSHQLTIRNTSTCNWVRSYATPRQVRLHLPTLRRVEQHGYGLVSNEGLWTQDTLYVRIQSAGDVSLNVHATYLYADDYDAGDLTLRGFAHDFHPGLGSNGFLFARDLQADYCYFFTFASWVGDAHVHPLLNLGGTLLGSGTLYYTGTPPFIDVRGPNASRLRQE